MQETQQIKLKITEFASKFIIQKLQKYMFAKNMLGLNFCLQNFCQKASSRTNCKQKLQKYGRTIIGLISWFCKNCVVGIIPYQNCKKKQIE